MTAFVDSDRTCIVQPTGTGKSYVISAVSESFPKVAIVGPNRFVLDQVRGGLSWRGNVDYMTYQKVNADGGMVGGDYDLIVLDEFHRVGAEKWGDSVNVFLAMNPQAKVLGASATPVRYLDGGRDMCEELFEGNVASRIGIGESWARGILPVPTYVTGLYSYDGVYDEAKERLDGNKVLSDKEREERMEKLISSKTHWEDSSGMAVILAKHLPKDTHRVIIFCSDVERLRSLSNPDDENGVVGWFRKAGFNVLSVNSVDYTKSRKVLDRERAEFESDTNGEGIRLMFSVDMFNEGVHIPDVGGVLMLRTTESKIIFMQQMGRCLTVANVVVPVVFDMVDNLSDIGVVKDFVKCISAEYEQEKEKLDVTERIPFKVVDYCLEVSDLIEKLCPEEPPVLTRDRIDEFCAWCEKEQRVPKAEDGGIYSLYQNILDSYRDDHRVMDVMRKYNTFNWKYDEQYLKDNVLMFVKRMRRLPSPLYPLERKYFNMYTTIKCNEPNGQYMKDLKELVYKLIREAAYEKICYAVEYYTKMKSGEDVSHMAKPQILWSTLIGNHSDMDIVADMRKKYGRRSPMTEEFAKKILTEYFKEHKCLPPSKWRSCIMTAIKKSFSDKPWFVKLVEKDKKNKRAAYINRYFNEIREYMRDMGVSAVSHLSPKDHSALCHKLRRLKSEYGDEPSVIQFLEEIEYGKFFDVRRDKHIEAIKDAYIVFLVEHHHNPRSRGRCDKPEWQLCLAWQKHKEVILKRWPEVALVIKEYGRPWQIHNAIQTLLKFEYENQRMPKYSKEEFLLCKSYHDLMKNHPDEPEVKAWIMKYGNDMIKKGGRK